MTSTGKRPFRSMTLPQQNSSESGGMGNSTQGGVLKGQAGLKTGRDIPEGRGGGRSTQESRLGRRGVVVGEIQFNGIKPKSKVDGPYPINSSIRIMSHAGVCACIKWI